MLLFESSRIADQIGNIDALPVKPGAPYLQDGDGNFRFLIGYSQIGGGDVL